MNRGTIPTVRTPTLLAKVSALAVILSVGCAAPIPAAHVEREKCYLEAEGAAATRVVRECPGSWMTCPARAVILDQLKKTEAQCM